MTQQVVARSSPPLPKARLHRVSSRPAWGLLVWGSRALGGIRAVARLLFQGSERRAAGLPAFGTRAAREAIGQPSHPEAPEAAEVPAVRAPDALQVAGLRGEFLDGGGPRAGALATAAVVKAWRCGRCAPSCCQEAGRLHVGLWRPEAVSQSAAPRIPQVATLHGRRDDRRALACRWCGGRSCRAELHEHSEAPPSAYGWRCWACYALSWQVLPRQLNFNWGDGPSFGVDQPRPLRALCRDGNVRRGRYHRP